MQETQTTKANKTKNNHGVVVSYDIQLGNGMVYFN